ncbi:MAG TPA: polysaccharide deacetylase, partial [Colwellia sp.]|nr:polysaccharide deacetylase [Colwellia sp.]
MKYLLQILVSVVLLLSIAFSSHAAVILQYHHVSDSTPASTSISPKQFEVHLQYLKDNNFKVVALSELIEGIKNQ